MKTAPSPEHQWLRQLIGNWTYEGRCLMGPGQPEAGTRGREKVRALGQLWVVVEGEGEMPGGEPFEMLTQIGFDPSSGRYKGTWIGSPMPVLWLYEGSVDVSGRILTLEARGPSMGPGGGMANYQDIIEIIGPDKRRFSSRIQLPDESWHEFMSADHTRVA